MLTASVQPCYGFICLSRIALNSFPTRHSGYFAACAKGTDPQKEWETEVANILKELPNIKKYEGRLGEGSEILLEAITATEALMKRVAYAFMYAGFSYNVDTTNQKSAAMFGKAQGMVGR